MKPRWCMQRSQQQQQQQQHVTLSVEADRWTMMTTDEERAHAGLTHHI